MPEPIDLESRRALRAAEDTTPAVSVEVVSAPAAPATSDVAYEVELDESPVLEGVPLQIDLEQLEDAKTSAGARAQLKEALRLYFRRVQGR